MSQRTEQEIMRNWKYMDPPLVSVCCTTYNHEPYIRDAIEGFLMQETDFPFEVIIHDDASTDRTAEIVREYAEQCPQIIKPIFQTENQYSKGHMISPTFVWPKARGEFIALCEGDDYWTDPRKLQIQIEEMGKHPDCDISFHPATVKYMDKSRPDRVQGRHRQVTCVIPLPEVIRGGGGFCPTASLVIKKKVLDNMPEWFLKDLPVGDLFVQIYGAKRGGALFINKTMSLYRAISQGSWSIRSMKVNLRSIELHKKRIFCTNLLKEDLPIEIFIDIDWLQSKNEYAFSILLLRNRQFLNYKNSIENSYRIFPCLNKKQVFLYKLRFLPHFVYLCDLFVARLKARILPWAKRF